MTGKKCWIAWKKKGKRWIQQGLCDLETSRWFNCPKNMPCRENGCESFDEAGRLSWNRMKPYGIFFFQAIEEFPDDFMKEGRQQPEAREREPF